MAAEVEVAHQDQASHLQTSIAALAVMVFMLTGPMLQIWGTTAISVVVAVGLVIVHRGQNTLALVGSVVVVVCRGRLERIHRPETAVQV
jgi:hypothetical protein